ncbi:hypothetical protein AAVH_16796 [Aphelenchoides avenae]|nr:hypothetical protein AAVH_16796 [Aphelenchus avenae]
MSYVASVPCGHNSLNACCQRHDQCYDEGYAPKLCDKEFCECVKASHTNYFCSRWLSFTHCQPVKALGSVLGRLAVAEWKSNEEAFERWKHRYRDYANRKRNRTTSAAPENTTDPRDSRESASNATQATDDDDINRTIVKERPLSRPERSIVKLLESA